MTFCDVPDIWWHSMMFHWYSMMFQDLPCNPMRFPDSQSYSLHLPLAIAIFQEFGCPSIVFHYPLHDIRWYSWYLVAIHDFHWYSMMLHDLSWNRIRFYAIPSYSIDIHWLTSMILHDIPLYAFRAYCMQFHARAFEDPSMMCCRCACLCIFVRHSLGDLGTSKVFGGPWSSWGDQATPLGEKVRLCSTRSVGTYGSMTFPSTALLFHKYSIDTPHTIFHNVPWYSMVLHTHWMTLGCLCFVWLPGVFLIKQRAHTHQYIYIYMS